jgi:protein phosphatase
MPALAVGEAVTFAGSDRAREDAACPATPCDRAASVRRAALDTAWGRLDLVAVSCRGKRHAVNEDSHSPLDGPAAVYVVADGVGGGALAWRASRELVHRVHRRLDSERIDGAALRDALLDADRAVAKSIANHTDAQGAATVALCACQGAGLSRWLVAWVGDCRVYRVAAGDAGDAELLTRDDTYRHLSETPPAGGSLDDPARMIGNGAVGIPNLVQVELGDDAMLVLCSDGMHRHVSAAEIGRVLRRASLPLARRCTRLIALARVRGSVDDATVLVVHRTARAALHEYGGIA